MKTCIKFFFIIAFASAGAYSAPTTTKRDILYQLLFNDNIIVHVQKLSLPPPFDAIVEKCFLFPVRQFPGAVKGDYGDLSNKKAWNKKVRGLIKLFSSLPENILTGNKDSIEIVTNILNTFASMFFRSGHSGNVNLQGINAAKRLLKDMYRIILDKSPPHMRDLILNSVDYVNGILNSDDQLINSSITYFSDNLINLNLAPELKDLVIKLLKAISTRKVDDNIMIDLLKSWSVNTPVQNPVMELLLDRMVSGDEVEIGISDVRQILSLLQNHVLEVNTDKRFHIFGLTECLNELNNFFLSIASDHEVFPQ